MAQIPCLAIVYYAINVLRNHLINCQYIKKRSGHFMINRWTNTTIEEINHSINDLVQQWNITDKDNDNIFDKIVGLQIRKIRLMRSTKFKKISQSKVARAINVTFQQIQKYEKGHNACPHRNLKKISEYLDVDINYFTKPLEDNNLTFKKKRRESDVYKFTRPQFMERQENTSHE
jgi:transcriptional regulator with XRE-family HTH domain